VRDVAWCDGSDRIRLSVTFTTRDSYKLHIKSFINKTVQNAKLELVPRERSKLRNL